MQRTWVFVTTSEREGWELTVIEVNACSTPYVAYDAPGLRDSIVNGKTGLLVKENENIEGLVKAIIKF